MTADRPYRAPDVARGGLRGARALRGHAVRPGRRPPLRRGGATAPAEDATSRTPSTKRSPTRRSTCAATRTTPCSARARLALTDNLTLLYSRRYLHEAADAEAHRAAVQDRPFSVLLIELTDISQVNGTDGYASGDQAIQRVASAVQRVGLRCGGTACRYSGRRIALLVGGDETTRRRLRGRGRGGARGRPERAGRERGLAPRRERRRRDRAGARRPLGAHLAGAVHPGLARLGPELAPLAGASRARARRGRASRPRRRRRGRSEGAAATRRFAGRDGTGRRRPSRARARGSRPARRRGPASARGARAARTRRRTSAPFARWLTTPTGTQSGPRVTVGAEQADVRVGRAEHALQDGLGREPGCGGDDSGGGSTGHGALLMLAPWLR